MTQTKYYKFKEGAQYAPTVGVFSHMVNQYEWIDGFITADGKRVITCHMTLNGKILTSRRKTNKGGSYHGNGCREHDAHKGQTAAPRA